MLLRYSVAFGWATGRASSLQFTFGKWETSASNLRSVLCAWFSEVYFWCRFLRNSSKVSQLRRNWKLVS